MKMNFFQFKNFEKESDKEERKSRTENVVSMFDEIINMVDRATVENKPKPKPKPKSKLKKEKAHGTRSATG